MTSPLLNLTGRNQLPIIRQGEEAECGLASLAMIANYHGLDIDLATLRRKYAIGLQGMNLRDVIEVATKMQFSTRPIKVPLELVNQIKLPAILHWDMKHFIVLASITSGKFKVHDPALGERTYTKSEFSQHFTGIALELTPSEKFEKRTEKTSLKVTDLWGNISGLKRYLVQLFTLSAVLQLFVLASPLYLQIAIDEVLPKFDTDLFAVIAIGFAGFTVINFLTHALRGYVLLYAGSMMSYQMVDNLFRHLIRLPISFFEKRHMGDLISRFGSLEPIQKMLTEGLISSLIDGAMAITTLLFMFLYSPFLASIALGAWLAYFWLRMIFYHSVRSAQEDVLVSKAKEQSIFMETVKGITSLKLFGCEGQREAIWRNKFADVINTNAKMEKLGIWMQSANAGIFGIEHIILVYVAVKMVLAGDFTIGMIFAFMAYKNNFSSKASALVEKAIEFRMLNLHLERIADIAHTDEEETDNEQGFCYAAQPFSGNISLENIWYRYADNTPQILAQVNLNIAAGDSIAIIGPSGCGKTTLLKILTGLFIPQEGQVLVDGRPLSEFGITRYRRQIGVVMQEDELFAGSVAENISFFDPESNMEKVKKAAQVAHIHEEIMDMPMKYESLVGDMGSALSGGQKQRIMLARAIYREPKVLFMDEGTAHLDVLTEQMVNQSIANLGITRVVIAHRPETIRLADKVFEFQDGNIVKAANKASPGLLQAE